MIEQTRAEPADPVAHRLQPAATGVPLLEARDLTVRFTVRENGLGGRARLTALDGVSLALRSGEVLGVVGESGSGKSTLAKAMAQLQPVTSGEVLLDGIPVRARGTRAFRRYCRQVQLVFQDPFASLNPLRPVRYHLADPLRIHRRQGDDLEGAIRALLDRVRLSPAERYADAYPHELSGGQRQRVSIARALAAGPRVLLADEPVSMLDVSIRLGVLDLLAELTSHEGVGILYITHDIASARHFADRVLVMYAGEQVEHGDSESVTQRPLHPYTRLLISSAPDPDAIDRGPAAGVDGSSAEPPSLITPPSGCRFHPRCPHAVELCARRRPPEVAVGGGRSVRCWGYATETTDLPSPTVPAPSSTAPTSDGRTAP